MSAPPRLAARGAQQLTCVVLDMIRDPRSLTHPSPPHPFLSVLFCREKEAHNRAVVLEMIGDLPEAEAKPPPNMLFICKLNPVTTEEDLEIIFARFGTITSCDIIRWVGFLQWVGGWAGLCGHGGGPGDGLLTMRHHHLLRH